MDTLISKSVSAGAGANALLDRWRSQILRQHRMIPYDPTKLRPGDSVLATPAYSIPYLYHYGVYVGDQSIVHVQKEGIVKCSLDEFCRDRTKVKIDPLAPLAHEVDRPGLMEKRRALIAETAKGMIGEPWSFNAFSENCESFTNWVTTGKMQSPQAIWFCNGVSLCTAALIGYAIGRGRFRFWRR